MKNTLLLFGLLFSMQYAFGQERITDFSYNGKGIDALTRTLSELNGSLIFNAYTDEYGDEMWIYKEEDGLNLLKDIVPGSTSSSPDYQFTGFTKFNNEIYFVANDSIHGYELWKTNGIETQIVHDVVGDTEYSFPNYLTLHGGFLYYIIEKENHYHLCKTDGVTLKIIKDFGENEYGVAYRPTKLVSSSDKVYFVVSDHSLWVSDGSENGTKEIKSLPYIFELISIGEQLFFTAGEIFQSERDLWISDGTESGTKRLKNIDDEIFSVPFNLINFNEELYFTAVTNEFGRELWKSNGTDEGTVQIIDINKGSEGAFSSYSFCVNYNELIFCANDGVNGNELWKTDGTESGTVMIKDINEGNGNSDPDELIRIQDYIYFQALDSIHGSELWKTDGTESGTKLVSDVFSGKVSSSPDNIILVGNEVFFIAESNSLGRQIWKIPFDEVNQLTEYINGIEISIYPNPCTDYLYLESDVIVDNIFFYDIKGQLISVEKPENEKVNISSLNSGIYFMKIIISGKTKVLKIIKQ